MDARFRKYGWLSEEMQLILGYSDRYELCDHDELEFDAMQPNWSYYETNEESEGDDD